MEEKEKPTGTDKNYLDQIEKLMSDNAKLQDEVKQSSERNKELLDKIVNGQKPTGTTPPKPEPVTDKMIKETIATMNNPKKEMLNIEYVETALKYRDQVKEKYGKDVFNISGDSNAAEKAERVADLLRHCVDVANGRSSVFTDELQQHLVDLNLPGKKF